MIADHAREADTELRKRIKEFDVPPAECWIGPDPDAIPARDGTLRFVLIHVPTGRRLAKSFPFRRLVTDSLF